VTLTLFPFAYGPKSRAELVGVEPRLVRVAERAIASSTEVDWAVHDGLRTLKQQEEYVRTGVSTTLNSKHLVQPDGYGHAVDLVPYVNGKLRWEPGPLYEIARLMQLAAKTELVELTWGGVWDRQLDELEGLEAEVQAYGDRRRKAGRRVFIDLPHFELWRG
jgi:peptidoglycan L-alanyl-D-glutamate endopeptidase CwlK